MPLYREHQPCDRGTISYAWIEPGGKVHVVPESSWHDQWAERKQRKSGRALVQDGWLRVTNVFNLALPPTLTSAQVEALVGLWEECAWKGELDPESDSLYVLFPDESHRVFLVADFARTIGGRKAEERVFEAALARAVGHRIRANPRSAPQPADPRCVAAGHSYAWIDPEGRLYDTAAEGLSHSDWADRYGDDLDADSGWDLLRRGWVRVANVLDYEFDVEQLNEAQQATLLRLALACVADGRFDPDDATRRVRVDGWSPTWPKQFSYSLPKWVERLGGRDAVERMYELAMDAHARRYRRNRSRR
jgi:hypothetical protein